MRQSDIDIIDKIINGPYVCSTKAEKAWTRIKKVITEMVKTCTNCGNNEIGCYYSKCHKSIRSAWIPEIKKVKK